MSGHAFCERGGPLGCHHQAEVRGPVRLAPPVVRPRSTINTGERPFSLSYHLLGMVRVVVLVAIIEVSPGEYADAFFRISFARRSSKT